MDVDRTSGVLPGLACGDALDRPIEFTSPRKIKAEHGRITVMIEHGTWSQPTRTITDDIDQTVYHTNLVEQQPIALGGLQEVLKLRYTSSGVSEW